MKKILSTFSAVFCFLGVASYANAECSPCACRGDHHGPDHCYYQVFMHGQSFQSPRYNSRYECERGKNFDRMCFSNDDHGGGHGPGPGPGGHGPGPGGHGPGPGGHGHRF